MGVPSLSLISDGLRSADPASAAIDAIFGAIQAPSQRAARLKSSHPRRRQGRNNAAGASTRCHTAGEGGSPRTRCGGEPRSARVAPTAAPRASWHQPGSQAAAACGERPALWRVFLTAPKNCFTMIFEGGYRVSGEVGPRLPLALTRPTGCVRSIEPAQARLGECYDAAGW